MKTIRNIIVLACSAGILCSCGLYSNFEKPRYGFEDDLCGQAASPADSNVVPKICWKDIFVDEQLRVLIDSALKGNVDIMVAATNLEKSKAALSASRMQYLPSVSLGGDLAWKPSDYTLTWPAQASWQVDLFGSLRNDKERKKALVQSSEAYVQAVQTDIVATVASLYYTLSQLDAKLKIYSRTKESWKENVEVTRHLMEAGQYSQAALSRAEANYYAICAATISAQDRIAAVENSLCSILGMTPRHFSRCDIDEWALPSALAAGIPSEVLASRPDVRKAEADFAAAFSLNNMARSSFFPSLTISGNLDFADMIGSAISSLTQPLLHRGELMANYKVAGAGLRGAEAIYRQTLIDAGIEVNDAIREINAAKAKGEYLDLQVKALEKSVKSTELLMLNGSETYLEVLTAEQALLQAEMDQTDNRLNEVLRTIDFFKAIGGTL